MRTPPDLPDLPDYLVEVVAKEQFERGHSPTSWDNAREVEKNGAREAAKLILRARAAQSDIKR